MELSSLQRWFRTPVALTVAPLVALAYLGAWAVQGDAPFFASGECAPGPAVAASPSPSGSTPAEGDEELSLDFGFRPDPLQPEAPVAWDFTVTNVSQEAVTLTFNSGQNGDVVLLQGGQEKYRWSEGQFFTQAIRNEELAAGESFSFTLDDTLPVETGSYELVASVASDPAPSPAQQSVTVGSPSSPSPSEPSPDPTSPEPSPSTSPTPSPTAGTILPSALPLAAPGKRRRRRGLRWRRILGAIAISLAVFVTPSGGIHAQEGSGGKNLVIAINETDGRTVGRSGVMMGHAAGPSVVPENLASARASCTDCRTVAVALQSVVITSNPSYASPRNAAVAVNENCTRCQTLAYAWQYVISTGGPVRLTPEGQQTVSDIRAEAASLAGSDLPFPQLVAELDALAAEFRAVMDTEVERVGGRGLAADRAVDVEDQC